MRLEKCCRKLPELSIYDLYDVSYGHYGEGVKKQQQQPRSWWHGGGRERSNPAKTTTTLRDGRKGDPQLNVVGKKGWCIDKAVVRPSLFLRKGARPHENVNIPYVGIKKVMVYR